MKRSINKKTLQLVISLCLFICVLAACMSAGAQSSDNPYAGTPYEERLTLDWIAEIQYGYKPMQGSYNQRILEEMFNVEINMVQLDILNPDDWSLFWSSGETADRIMNNDRVKELVDQGLIRSINKNWLYEYMPTYMEKLATLLDGVGGYDFIDSLLVYNDNVWQIPFCYVDLSGSGINLIRKDWLDAVGMQVPTTLDELHDVLYAFTYNDPDKNGVNDTYGMHGGGNYPFNYIFGAFGIFQHSYALDDNRKAYFTDTTDAYRQGLTLLNNWYAEGIIDPEFSTDNRSLMREKWSAGKFGMLCDNAYWAASTLGDSSVVALLENADPNAEVIPFAAVTGPSGLAGSLGYYPGLGNNTICFGKDTSDEKVLRIMQIMESIAADRELYEQMFYGIEGIHYTKENGVIQVSSDVTTDTVVEYGLAQTFAFMSMTFDDLSFSLNERDRSYYAISLTQPVVFRGHGFAQPEVNRAYEIKGEDINTLAKEYFVKAITGKVEIDTTFDAFVESLYSAGLQDILDEYDLMLAK